MALDSLASWLVEGSPSIESELAAPGPAAQITAIFQAHAAQSDVEVVSHMLDALIKMLKHSPKITVRVLLRADPLHPTAGCGATYPASFSCDKSLWWSQMTMAA